MNTSESTHVIETEIIWHNSEIKCINKILFNNVLYKKGIKLIERIYYFRIQKFYNLIQLQNFIEYPSK